MNEVLYKEKKASRYAALESRMDSLKKEWESKGIQYDIFNGFFVGT